MSSGEDGAAGAPDARYRMIRRLGAGGAATVHLAEDVRLGRPVAIKRLHAESPDDAVRRFRREARVGAAFTHPNMVTIYDAHSDGDSVVIVMEYVDGETLEQALERGRMAPEEALDILRPVAAALDTAHAHGVVHRDVKPANILLGAGARVKLTDFGIASAAEATRITQAGAMLGTLAYMAPEQLAGEDVSPSADVYSLAAVAFEMLAGRRARAGTTPFEILHRAQADPPPDLRDAVPEAPAGAADVLRRALSADPAERPRTPGALVEELARGLGVSARVPAAPRKPETTPTRPESPPVPVAAAPPEARRAGARSLAPQRTPAPRLARPRDRVAAPVAPSRASRGRALAAAAALAAVVVVIIVVLASRGGSGSSSADRATGTTTTSHNARTKTTATGSARATGPTSTPAAPPASGGDATLSPAGTVRAFYERAAAGRFEESYALLAPAFKQKFGDFAEFKRELGTLKAISFASLHTVTQSQTTAVVALESTATHTTHVDRCRGELALIRASSGGWLVNPRSVACTSSAT